MINAHIKLRLQATAEYTPKRKKSVDLSSHTKLRKKGGGGLPAQSVPTQSEETLQTYTWMPRLYALCKKYRLSAVECDVMHIITIVQVMQYVL